GALHIAQLALPALVDDRRDLLGGQRLDFALPALLVPVDGVEQRRERRAVAEAHAAGVADVEHAAELAVELRLIPVFRISKVKHRPGLSPAPAPCGPKWRRDRCSAAD